MNSENDSQLATSENNDQAVDQDKDLDYKSLYLKEIENSKKQRTGKQSAQSEIDALQTKINQFEEEKKQINTYQGYKYNQNALIIEKSEKTINKNTINTLAIQNQDILNIDANGVVTDNDNNIICKSNRSNEYIASEIKKSIWNAEIIKRSSKRPKHWIRNNIILINFT